MQHGSRTVDGSVNACVTNLDGAFGNIRNNTETIRKATFRFQIRDNSLFYGTGGNASLTCYGLKHSMEPFDSSK